MQARNPSDDSAIAAFLATRGATRVTEGAHTLPTDHRYWHAALRGELPKTVDVDPTQIKRVAAIDSYGREVIVNGYGEWIATE
jgi:hypothetical protein